MTENIDILARLRGARQVSQDAKRAGDAIGGIDTQARRAGAGLASLKYGAGLAAAAFGGLAVKVGIDSFNAFRNQARINRQTAAVIKSTGGAANVTAGDIAALAGALATKTGIDDDAIQSGQNLLLTFKGIRNEAGQGNRIFDAATRAALDMSVALGKDMRSSAILVGKALNDPVKGLTAMQRVGVSFTEGQRDQIKALVKSGRAMEAQKLILRELNSEFGGSAAAQSDPLKKLSQSWGELKETIGGAVAPAVMDASRWLARFVDEMRAGTGTGGEFVRTIRGIVVPVGQAARDMWQFARANPELVKLAAALAAAGVALKAITFTGQITGITRLLGLTGRLGPAGAKGGLALAEGIAGAFFPNWAVKSGGIKETVRRTMGTAGTAAGQSAAATATTGFASGLPGRLSRQMPGLTALFRGFGRTVGVAFGIAVAAEAEKAIGDKLTELIGGDTQERRQTQNNNDQPLTGDPLQDARNIAGDALSGLMDSVGLGGILGHRSSRPPLAPASAPVSFAGAIGPLVADVPFVAAIEGRPVAEAVARVQLREAARR